MNRITMKLRPILCWLCLCIPQLAFAWGEAAQLPAQTQRFLGCQMDSKPRSGLLGGIAGTWTTYSDHDFSQPQWWRKFDNDLNQLRDRFPPSLFLVAGVDIRNIDGHYGFRYFGNGGAHSLVSPWSSSKWMAALNTMVRLHRHGLSAHSALGPHHMGDLITTSHTGLATPTVTRIKSNYIGTLFQNIAGRRASDALVKQWLGRPRESFAGGYGASIAHSTINARDLVSGKQARLTLSSAGRGRSKISPLSFAEALKRVATHEDPTNNVRFPGIDAHDIRLLFYGHPARELGGMLAAYEEAIRPALGSKSTLDARTNGEWRIFTKTGSASWHTGREQLVNGIICLPQFDGGRFLTVSFYVRGPVRKAGLRRLQEGFRTLVDVLLPGFRGG